MSEVHSENMFIQQAVARVWAEMAGGFCREEQLWNIPI